MTDDYYGYFPGEFPEEAPPPGAPPPGGGGAGQRYGPVTSERLGLEYGVPYPDLEAYFDQFRAYVGFDYARYPYWTRGAQAGYSPDAYLYGLRATQGIPTEELSALEQYLYRRSDVAPGGLSVIPPSTVPLAGGVGGGFGRAAGARSYGGAGGGVGGAGGYGGYAPRYEPAFYEIEEQLGGPQPWKDWFLQRFPSLVTRFKAGLTREELGRPAEQVERSWAEWLRGAPERKYPFREEEPLRETRIEKELYQEYGTRFPFGRYGRPAAYQPRIRTTGF